MKLGWDIDEDVFNRNVAGFLCEIFLDLNSDGFDEVAVKKSGQP